MKIPFDYEKYCTGKYDVQTQSGKAVNGLVKFDTTDDLCLYASVQSSVESWTIKGKWNGYSNAHSSNDLVLVKKKVGFFKNVYENEAGQYYLGNVLFNTEEEAKKNIGESSKSRYIQTIEIIDEL